MGRELQPHACALERLHDRGMEFGVSPFPETRRAMIDRGRLFDTPCFRWIGAKKRVSAEYYAAVGRAPAMPETLDEFGHALGIPT